MTRPRRLGALLAVLIAASAVAPAAAAHEEDSRQFTPAFTTTLGSSCRPPALGSVSCGGEGTPGGTAEVSVQAATPMDGDLPGAASGTSRVYLDATDELVEPARRVVYRFLIDVDAASSASRSTLGLPSSGSGDAALRAAIQHVSCESCFAYSSVGLVSAYAGSASSKGPRQFVVTATNYDGGMIPAGSLDVTLTLSGGAYTGGAGSAGRVTTTAKILVRSIEVGEIR